MWGESLGQQDLRRHDTLMQQEHMTVHDHMRKGVARDALGASAEPMMLKAERKLFHWENQPVDSKERARMTLVMLGLVGGPASFYVVMMTAWFKIYYQSFAGTVAVLSLLVVISLSLIIGESLSRVRRRWMLFLGLLCLEATVIGLLIGFRCYFGGLVYYYRYQDMRPYSNVGGSQPSSSFNDASMFLFTEDTRIDPLRSVGYQSRWTGDTYCAAPIIDSTMSNANDIYYWAVGENCCNARSEYDCDDAREDKVRSALVVLEPEDIVRPFMRWAVAGSVYPKFERAIKLQQATYLTKASSKIKLIRWSKDPVALKDSYYYAAIQQAVGWGAAVFVLITLQAWAISFFVLFGNRKSRTENAPLRDAAWKQP